MILVRAWQRQLLGGVSAAAFVPASLLAAVALLALAGGFSGLGALGQAFSGPSLPSLTASGAPAARAGRTISPAVLAALAAPRAGSTQSPAVAPVGQSHRRAGGPTDTQLAPGPRHSGGPVRQLTSASTPPRAPAPKPHPTVWDQAVAAVTSATNQLPAPAGPAASGALQSAGSALNQVAPVPAPSPPKVP